MQSVVASENCTYAETNYANPHAPTAFFDGMATMTYSYDAIGNLATTSGAATSTFNWDYRNRLMTVVHRRVSMRPSASRRQWLLPAKVA